MLINISRVCRQLRDGYHPGVVIHITFKYCQPRHGRTWTLVGTRVDKNGKPDELALVRAGDTPIQRHVKAVLKQTEPSSQACLSYDD